jgi:enoyl-CoA hydratase
VKTISVEKQDHVAIVTLESLTMPPPFFQACGDAFRSLAEDDDVRAAVVRASGKAFSYGLDLGAAFSEMGSLLQGPGAAERTELVRTIRRWQADFEAIRACPFPVIAAIHGRCIGGGLDLASACDIRLATKDARISLRETKVAIVADLGSLQRLPAIIGAGHTREMAFTGRDVDAERALRIGLVNDVYETREELDAAAMKLAGEIAENAPLTVQGVKHVLDVCEDKSVAAGLDYVATWNAAFFPSQDLGEAVQAFMQKRKPRFTGK